MHRIRISRQRYWTTLFCAKKSTLLRVRPRGYHDQICSLTIRCPTSWTVDMQSMLHDTHVKLFRYCTPGCLRTTITPRTVRIRPLPSKVWYNKQVGISHSFFQNFICTRRHCNECTYAENNYGTLINTFDKLWPRTLQTLFVWVLSAL